MPGWPNFDRTLLSPSFPLFRSSFSTFFFFSFFLHDVLTNGLAELRRGEVETLALALRDAYLTT